MFIPRALSTLAVVLWASATFAQQPPAGTVRVRILDAAGGQISSQDYASGSNITVALGLVATPRTVHIFATNTLNQRGNHAPDGGIGTLTITGTANATGRVNIFVADGDETFPSLAAAADALTPGLTTLGGTVNSNASSNGGYAHDYDAAPWATSNSAPSYGGPVFADWGNANLKGIIIPDPSLRRQTVLAAVVAGDICPDANGAGTKGRIEVGQVLRLEAR